MAIQFARCESVVLPVATMGGAARVFWVRAG
jgi:hypothetical protein